MLSVAVIFAGALSALPLAGASTVVIFKDGTNASEAFLAVASAGGRPIWSAPRGEIMVVDLPFRSDTELYARGALLVTSAIWFGCFPAVSSAERWPSLKQS